MRTNIKILTLLFILSLSLTQCVIVQEIHFNEDFSGKYKFKYDFTEYLKLIKEDEKYDSVFQDQAGSEFSDYAKDMEKLLSEINGITNLRIIDESENGILSYSFDFDGIESLNECLKSSSFFDEDAVSGVYPYFEKKRNRLFYFRKPIELENEPESDNSLNEFFIYNLIISFEKSPRKIDIDDSDVIIEHNGKLIKEADKLNEFWSKDVSWEFCFNRLFCW